MPTATDERARGRYVCFGESWEENRRGFEREGGRGGGGEEERRTGGEGGREGDGGSEREEGVGKEEARRSESKSS
eukprot:1058312-Rhodomonas_salina.1